MTSLSLSLLQLCSVFVKNIVFLIDRYDCFRSFNCKNEYKQKLNFCNMTHWVEKVHITLWPHLDCLKVWIFIPCCRNPTLESLKMLQIEKKLCVQYHFSLFLPKSTEFLKAFTYKSTVLLIKSTVRKKYCKNRFCHLTTWITLSPLGTKKWKWKVITDILPSLESNQDIFNPSLI